MTDPLNQPEFKKHEHIIMLLAAILTIVFIGYSLYKGSGVSSASTGSSGTSSATPAGYVVPGGVSTSDTGSGITSAISTLAAGQNSLAAQLQTLETQATNSAAQYAAQVQETQITATADEAIAALQAGVAQTQAENNITLSFGNNLSNGFESLFGYGGSTTNNNSGSSNAGLSGIGLGSISLGSSGSSATGTSSTGSAGTEAENNAAEQFSVSGLNSSDLNSILAFLSGSEANELQSNAEQNSYDLGYLNNTESNEILQNMFNEDTASGVSIGYSEGPNGVLTTQRTNNQNAKPPGNPGSAEMGPIVGFVGGSLPGGGGSG